jgi:hypothetical protein
VTLAFFCPGIALSPNLYNHVVNYTARVHNVLHVALVEEAWRLVNDIESLEQYSKNKLYSLSNCLLLIRKELIAWISRLHK